MPVAPGLALAMALLAGVLLALHGYVLAFAATLAWLNGRAALAGASFFLALFAKESVAPLPLILMLWEGAGAPGARERVVRALTRTLPLWLATAGWAAVVFAVRVWRRAWAPGSSVPVADVTLRLDHVWEGFRSALLTYVSLDQPMVYLREAARHLASPWLAIALLAAVALLASRL